MIICIIIYIIYLVFGLASLKDRVGVVNYTRFSQPTCRINEEEINYIQE